MELPTLHYNNKVYSLKPKFITNLQDYLRKIKLGRYKKKKVNKSKTAYKRFYHMKFKIHIDDDVNHQTSEMYETIVPATAAFFAKALLERSMKEKMSIEVVNLEEMTDEEHEEFLLTKNEFITQEKLN